MLVCGESNGFGFGRDLDELDRWMLSDEGFRAVMVAQSRSGCSAAQVTSVWLGRLGFSVYGLWFGL